MRKNKKWTIEEKNKIVEEYLSGERAADLMRKYAIKSNGMLARWVAQYRKNGSTLDGRGRGRNSTRKANKSELKPEEMTREELIEYVKAVEDIKKYMASQDKQNKNTKQ